MSLLAGLVIYLFVEAPIRSLTNHFLTRRRSRSVIIDESVKIWVFVDSVFQRIKSGFFILVLSFLIITRNCFCRMVAVPFYLGFLLGARCVIPVLHFSTIIVTNHSHFNFTSSFGFVLLMRIICSKILWSPERDTARFAITILSAVQKGLKFAVRQHDCVRTLERSYVWSSYN